MMLWKISRFGWIKRSLDKKPVSYNQIKSKQEIRKSVLNLN